MTPHGLRLGHRAASPSFSRGCVMTTILPFVFFAAILIGAGMIWLVMRSMQREANAARQLIERQREAWRAGGCVGPKPGVRDDSFDGWFHYGEF